LHFPCINNKDPKVVLRSFFVVVMLAWLVGCASTAQFEKNVGSWIGYDADELIASWGPPDDY
jgi:hypothetical protein